MLCKVNWKPSIDSTEYSVKDYVHGYAYDVILISDDFDIHLY